MSDHSTYNNLSTTDELMEGYNHAISTLAQRGYASGVVLGTLYYKDIFEDKKFLGLFPYRKYCGHVSVFLEPQYGRIMVERRDEHSQLVSQLRTTEEHGDWGNNFNQMLEDMEK
jgi:hypothetical protein